MKDISLHPRQRKLIYILNGSHGILKGQELAQRLGISERTIRTDVSEINRIMAPDLAIKAVYGKGYSLYMKDRNLFHQLFSKEDNIESKEDRIRYLIIRLIKEEGWANMDELEESLFVSHTTFENDIKTMKAQVGDKSPYLKLIKNGNCISFENSEDKKRRVLIQIYCENWDYDSREGIVLKSQYINQSSLNQIRVVLKEILRKENIILDDFGLIYLTMSIAVAYSRILDGHTIEPDEILEPAGKNVNLIWDTLSAQWNLEVSPAERSWTDNILNQLIILGFTNHTKEEALAMTNKSCKENADRILSSIKEEYSLDFSKDEELYTSLVLHLQALRNNMMSVQEQNEYVFSQLKKEYPKLADIAEFMRTNFEELYNMKLGETEECYLLPLLIPAWEKLVKEKIGKGIPTVVVSHLNSAMTQLLIYKLQETFGDKLNIMGSLPIYDKDKIDELDPKLIISTVQMNAFRTFNVPIAIASAILTPKEESEIQRHIRNILDSFFDYV